MEVQIMSIITYLLLFNSCLTFRLTFINNIVITFILTINIVFINEKIGSLFVIPMFLLVIVYIAWIKKKEWLSSIFLIIFSYTSFVIVDNLTHLIWSLIGLNLTEHWFIYMLIDYPIFYMICRFAAKNVTKIKSENLLALESKVLAIVGIDLVLCMFIFVIHITVTEQSGSSSSVLLSSIILYIAYFILTFLMITMIIRYYETNAKIMLKQHSYDNLQGYIMQMEEFYQELRVFRHDYANIMVSMVGYIESNDIEGLKKYYDTYIFPMEEQLDKEKDAIAKLHNLDIIELKSLISVKLNRAIKLHIDINVEIIERINKVNIKIIDLVRIVGILMDNAIEACQVCKKPSIDFCIIKFDENITLVIKNTYVRQSLDYSRLGNLGVSSKGERRGIGLYNIKSIINSYNNVIMDTEYGDKYFIQTLEIYDEM